MKNGKSFQEIRDEQNPIVKELERQLKEQKKIIEEIQIDSGQLNLLFNKVVSALSSIDPQPILYKPQKESKNHGVIPVLQDTDWHIGEYQKGDEIENINEYNYEIAKRRIADLTHRENRIIDRFRNAYSISESVMIVTGDMITGNLRDEANRTNEFMVPEQVVKAAEQISSRIMGLAQNIGHLRVEYFTADNHSRLTKKPESKDQGINSFNYLVAVMIQKIIERQNNIEFNIRTELQGIVNIGDLRYLCMHGHQIKSWSGHAWYGWDRKVGRESKSRLSIIMEDFDKIMNIGYNKIVAGHFHEPINTIHFMLGGSLMGTTAHDHENSRYAPPSQPMWFVDKKYGEFGRIDFKL